MRILSVCRSLSNGGNLNSELEGELEKAEWVGELSRLMATTRRATGGGKEPGPGRTGLGRGGRQRLENNDLEVVTVGSSAEQDRRAWAHEMLVDGCEGQPKLIEVCSCPSPVALLKPG